MILGERATVRGIGPWALALILTAIDAVLYITLLIAIYLSNLLVDGWVYYTVVPAILL